MTHRPAVLALALTVAITSLAALGCSDGGGEPAASKPAPTRPTTPSTPTPSTPAKAPAAPEESAAASPADLAKRGRQVYMGNCIACHSQDPAIDGALGPAVAGSSRELLEARVLRAEYPEGYTPKRPSKVMIALPHLAGEIDALTAFLAAGG